MSRQSTFTLSKRLKAYTDLIFWKDSANASQVLSDGLEKSVADIGCDHGHLLAHLILNGTAEYAVASDINIGPIEAASKTFTRLGLMDKAELRLGDGLSVLSPNEVRVCFICGMGGMNIISILESKPEVVNSFKQMILSPERDADALRRYLHTIGFFIYREICVEDKGHFYFGLDARKGCEEPYDPIGYLFGRRLLEKKDITLEKFLLKEQSKIIKKFDKMSPMPASVADYFDYVTSALDIYS